MDDMRFIAWPFLIPIAAIIGSFTYVIVQTLAKARVRELEVRERIAMIERGLVPPPEVDPRGFDRAMDRYDRYDRYRERAPGRHRRAGITLMGVGFGLMVLIGFTADPSVAVGVGGFLVVMGLAFLINSRFDSRNDERTPTNGPRTMSNSSPITPSDPPRRD